jgi:AraC-like DNA-binding protein
MLFSYHNQVLDKAVIGDYIWNQLRFRKEQSIRSSLQKTIPARIRAAMTYLDEHFADALCVEEVAAQVGLSASHLHVRFREYLDETPHQYLIRNRMRAAAHWLVRSDLPVKVIALDAGYLNVESFCRAFKKYYGRTAATHRKMYQNF